MPPGWLNLPAASRRYRLTPVQKSQNDTETMTDSAVYVAIEPRITAKISSRDPGRMP